MERLVFAIPSLGRASVISEQTIKTLRDLEVPDNLIHVFVVGEEKEIYAENLPEGVEIVVGERGVGNQRTFINSYFPKGTRIVLMDDDVQIVVKEGAKTRILTEPLIPLVEKAFDLCDEVGAKMWGVCNTTNGFFMKHDCVFGLRVPYGAFHGEYSQDADTQSTLPHSEDFEKGLKHYLKYGGFIRLNDFGVKQKRYSAGGVNENLGGKEGRLKVYQETADYILDTYPELAKPSNKPDPEKGLLKIKNKTTSRHSSILEKN